MRPQLFAAAVCAFSLFACGGGDDGGGGGGGDGDAANAGTASLTGSSGGFDFSTLKNAIGAISTDSNGSELFISFTSEATCGGYATGDTRGTTQLELSLYDTSGSAVTAPTHAETFTGDLTAPGPYVVNVIVTFAAACMTNPELTQFGSATVTLTSVGSGGDGVAAGSLTLSTDTGETVTGSFSSAGCTEVATGQRNAACSP